MGAKLFCKYGELRGSSFEIEEEALIGRETTCAITLPHPLVSSRHARIYRDKEHGGYLLEDLDSLNGTVVDGIPVSRPVPLGLLHVVNFGGVCDFFFKASPAEKTASPPVVSEPAQGEKAKQEAKSEAKPTAADGVESSTNPDREFIPMPTALGKIGADESNTQSEENVVIVPQALREEAGRLDNAPAKPKSASRYRLIFFNLKRGPLVYELEEGENIVGRGSEVRCRIPSNEVSRRHAALTVKKGTVRLRDLGSTNHTFIEKKEINGEVVVFPGATLSFGKVEAKLDRMVVGSGTVRRKS